eukprot:TRINITY_DN3420_c0_g1_i1.p1 TRINITY_DN3420_c0_g1~~TRINITY_DN3420_c0_g1_i1.p1  ORF type:complete len:289 (+),score=128.65 TRINITY_DN3420_c0_g1_i1:46-867(+)
MLRSLVGSEMCIRDRYMYKGKKFNSKKEDVPEDTYLGIMVFRFYVNCQRCNLLISFKTDPQNSDYVCEHGASRNFEPWRARADEEEEVEAEQQAKEEVDAMNRLERVTQESKREMDILDALDEVKMMNAANNVLSGEAMLANLRDKDLARAKKAEEVFEDADNAAAAAAFASTKEQIRRIEDAEKKPEPEPMAPPPAAKPSATSIWGQNILKQKEDKMAAAAPKPAPRRGLVGIKRKVGAPEPAPAPAPAPVVGLGLGYSSSSSEGSPPREAS